MIATVVVAVIGFGISFLFAAWFFVRLIHKVYGFRDKERVK